MSTEPGTGQLALLEWAEQAGDRGPIACDLAAERGSIVSALPELRTLFSVR